LWAGCSPAREIPASVPPSPAPSHYLGEPFSVAGASCSLLSAQPALTEPRLRPIGRPPEDVSVVALELGCRDGGDSSLARPRTRFDIRQLPVKLRWLDDARVAHPPSTRTALSEREPERVLFEVPAGQAGLCSPRRYDARSGDPRGSRELRHARLHVDVLDDKEQVVASHVVAPWPRGHDRALDSFLDVLARTLASGAPFDTLSDSEAGHAAIRGAAELYQRVVARADQMVVRELTAGSTPEQTSAPRLTLALEQGGGSELALFEFELDTSHGEPRVRRALAPESSRSAVQCAEDASSLEARTELVAAPSASCNALGRLLPGSCQDAEPGLLRDALRVGTQCELDRTLGLDPAAHAAPPADFEVRLRRGRSFARLDRAPHYTVSIARSGRVHFEGQQRVRALGAHEGRTSTQMVAALADRFARMGWFEREDAQPCRASDDRGDQFDVRAWGRTRMLRDREGCRGGFSAAELELTRAAIERAAGVAAWLAEPSPSIPYVASPRATEIWMVAAE
jgi:Domain of unknown function (DUF6438)